MKSSSNAYSVVELFESRVAEYAGSKYAVAVDCCTHAIFLCLKYLGADHVILPKKTYCSVPMAAIQAGATVQFKDIEWRGAYRLDPYPIWDGAKRFRKGMFLGGFHCLSFHVKKLLPIGRGGMILTDDAEAVKWLKRARYDGREGKPYDQECVNMLGYHFYMTPEQAARGLQLLELYQDQPDQTEDYPDLSEWPAFK